MGRCTVTKGQRRIGKTIRKLEGSVELSDKESKAKVAEKDSSRKPKQPQATQMIRLYRICVTQPNGKRPITSSNKKSILPGRTSCPSESNVQQEVGKIGDPSIWGIIWESC